MIRKKVMIGSEIGSGGAIFFAQVSLNEIRATDDFNYPLFCDKRQDLLPPFLNLSYCSVLITYVSQSSRGGARSDHYRVLATPVLCQTLAP